MDKIELLAKDLFDIHNNQLKPFYDGDQASSWQDLEEVTNNSKDVDKVFFRTIAKDFIERYNKDPEFIAKLPQLLYELHGSYLPPYYISFENYEIYHNDPENVLYNENWWTLEEDVNDIERVDKKFFQDVAKHIINVLKM